jgi:hypothetical protein
MFHRERMIAALEAKADRFTGSEAAVSDALAGYEQALEELAGLSRVDIDAGLAGVDWPGGRPTAEHDQHFGIIAPFGQPWANYQQARAWAREVLAGEV